MSYRGFIRFVVFLLLVTLPFWLTYLLWRNSETIDVPTLVVDYTVPIDNYREHRGIHWVLNHFRVEPPPGANEWRAPTDYLGYDPKDRPNPRRIEDLPSLPYEFIYVADAYGVYEADIPLPDGTLPHLGERSPLIFGGLSATDASMLSDFADAGNDIVIEFNAICDPTGHDAREVVEQMVGVDWTGWVGRVFQDLYDETDVPAWLPREFAAQYPGRELPRDPSMLLAHRSGRLMLFSSPLLEDITPVIEMTENGREHFDVRARSVPQFFWFSIMTVAEDTDVHAILQMPDHDELTEALEHIGVGRQLPLFTERRASDARRYYIGADLADIGFDAGSYRFSGISRVQAAVSRRRDEVSQRPAFWQFYVPVMREIVDRL